MPPSVSALSYVVFSGPVDAWIAYATEVLGLEHVTTRDDTAYFRMDGESYRVAVQEGPGGPASLIALGLTARNEEDLLAIVDRLTDSGVTTVEDPELARRRHARRLFTAQDPEGNTIELVFGRIGDHTRFVSPAGVEFVAGDLGLGHVFLSTPNCTSLAAFYRDMLGFELSDTIASPGPDTEFLHCNGRHHTLAVGFIPEAGSGIGHVMLEVTDLEGVGRALDAVRAGKAPLAMEIGMHSNDHMISFYSVTPSGFLVEYGCNGRVVGDDWTVGRYTAISNWGHWMSDGAPSPGVPVWTAMP